jgi:hypothetical protein
LQRRATHLPAASLRTGKSKRAPERPRPSPRLPRRRASGEVLGEVAARLAVTRPYAASMAENNGTQLPTRSGKRAMMLALASSWLCLCSSSCITSELWADDASVWPLARDVPARIEAAYVDDASRVHILVQTEDARFVYTVPMPSHPFRVRWIGGEEIEPINDAAAATWVRPTTVPLAIVFEDKHDVGQAFAAGSQAVGQAFAAGSQLVLSLDPHRHTIINGELDIYFIANAGPERHYLPLLPVRWLSLNAAGHVAATPLCVAADIVLLPVYLVYAGLAAAGVVKTHP